MRISDWSSDVCSSDLITQRLSLYHRPYHDTLTAELDRLKAAHGKVVLYDAHSIRSHVPRLFDGELPQFNIGTNGGATAAPELETIVANICAASGQRSEEHTSELQSLMRISYAVFCLKKKKKKQNIT